MRRFGFWIALVGVLAFVGIDIRSIRHGLMWQTRSGFELEVMGGVCNVRWSNRSFAPSCTIQPHNWGLRPANFDGNFSGQFYVRFPLWLPVVLTALAAIALGWPRRRKRKPTECATCGYDLRGQVPVAEGVRCPECGATQDAPPATRGTLN